MNIPRVESFGSMGIRQDLKIETGKWEELLPLDEIRIGAVLRSENNVIAALMPHDNGNKDHDERAGRVLEAIDSEGMTIGFAAEFDRNTQKPKKLRAQSEDGRFRSLVEWGPDGAVQSIVEFRVRPEGTEALLYNATNGVLYQEIFEPSS